MIAQSREEGCEERPLSVSHTPEMIPAERRARIVDALQAQRAVKVATLSEALGVSEITIRRDLVILGREGLLARTYGGAVLRKRSTDDSGREGAEVEQAAEKARIAKAAAAMIEPRDTVFLGAGTTVAHILRYVDPELEARVVTPSLGAAAETQGLRLEIVFLGGLYRPQSNAVEGTWPLDMIGHFHADKAFLGADGLDSMAGLTTPSIAVAAIELAMIRRTRGEVVVLADNNKIGLICQVVICPLDQIDVVLVDTGVDREVRKEIQRAGPRCEAV
jgi:DeoR/GlpR family transcriptional regulator of sugar metabolism